jgi:hypothetical protein
MSCGALGFAHEFLGLKIQQQPTWFWDGFTEPLRSNVNPSAVIYISKARLLATVV